MYKFGRGKGIKCILYQLSSISTTTSFTIFPYLFLKLPDIFKTVSSIQGEKISKSMQHDMEIEMIHRNTQLYAFIYWQATFKLCMLHIRAGIVEVIFRIGLIKSIFLIISQSQEEFSCQLWFSPVLDTQYFFQKNVLSLQLKRRHVNKQQKLWHFQSYEKMLYSFSLDV